VVITPVGRHDVQPVLSFSANLEPFWTADLSPKVDGRVAVLNVDEGDKVAAGAVVATLDTDELLPQVTQAEGSVYAARANLEQAELDLKRATPLAQQGAISAQALDTARIKRDLAIGQLRSAEGTLAQLRARFGNANIIAPRDGIITKRYLQAGYYAKTGSPVVSLADVSSMLVKASVGESEISQMKLGTVATVRVTALGDRQLVGKVTRLTPAAALPVRTFTAEVTVPNADGLLLAGMFARVEVAGDVRKNVIAVPESALVLREDQKSVYVVADDNKVQQRILKLGYIGGGWAEVLEGLKEGENIVTGGQNKLRDGSTIDRAGGKGE
ncbi:MAG TPA: efflux RND transporter periplasmic adaptor subunit, partial [Negativicutes bacterium]|nr:efflux RND transporter periplasmic adaptor subunit [Negativicutes bacterium]